MAKCDSGPTGPHPIDPCVVIVHQRERITRLQKQLADARNVVDALHRILETKPGEDITLVAARRMRQARQPQRTAKD